VQKELPKSWGTRLDENLGILGDLKAYPSNPKGETVESKPCRLREFVVQMA